MDFSLAAKTAIHTKLDKIIVLQPELLMNPSAPSGSVHAASTLTWLKTCGIILYILSTIVTADQNGLHKIPGWQQDNLEDVLNGWRNSCTAFRKQNLHDWHRVCLNADNVNPADTEAVRAYFETNFDIQPILNDDGSSSGIITGYFQPVLSGSLIADNRFRYPIYGKPASDSLRTLSRRAIYERPQDLKEHIIAWTDNPIDLFFLHIQGSGLIRFQDGTQKSLAYAGNNDHAYTSIGKVLHDAGAMRKDEISMQTLKQWLAEHPQQALDVMHKNQRFIYFELSELSVTETGPRGSLNVPLTPLRSIAMDPQQIRLGSPVWLDTTLPSEDQPERFQRLVFAQDTGAAIKGRVRADLFFGQGKRAEFLAGNMNQPGRMYLLTPRRANSD